MWGQKDRRLRGNERTRASVGGREEIEERKEFSPLFPTATCEVAEMTDVANLRLREIAVLRSLTGMNDKSRYNIGMNYERRETKTFVEFLCSPISLKSIVSIIVHWHMGIELNFPKCRNPVPPGCHESFGEREGWGVRTPRWANCQPPLRGGEKWGGTNSRPDTPKHRKWYTIPNSFTFSKKKWQCTMYTVHCTNEIKMFASCF